MRLSPREYQRNFTARLPRGYLFVFCRFLSRWPFLLHGRTFFFSFFLSVLFFSFFVSRGRSPKDSSFDKFSVEIGVERCQVLEGCLFVEVVLKRERDVGIVSLGRRWMRWIFFFLGEVKLDGCNMWLYVCVSRILCEGWFLFYHWIRNIH